MPGYGWCVNSEGEDATARKFLEDTSYSIASAICSSDEKCAGFAYAWDTRQAVVYTTTGCTSSCSNAAWTNNPTLIIGANWCCGHTGWQNAICYRKKSGKH